MKIKNIVAYHQFDSRGFPTVAVAAIAENGLSAKAIVPSGASTGIKEAVELRDDVATEFNGKGVFKAIDNVNNIIAPKVIGLSVFDQAAIDRLMIEIDGTENKGNLGANAILAVSMAIAHLAAKVKGIPLYRYIAEDLIGNKSFQYSAPRIMVNIINGGAHGNNMLDFQEFMICPKQTSMFEQTKIASEVFHSLAKELKKIKYATGKGDEGGYDTNIKSVQEGLDLLENSVKNAGYTSGEDVFFTMDVAASEFCEDNKYTFKIDPSKQLSVDEMIKFYEELVANHPIISIEDPLDESDWAGFAKITSVMKAKNVLIVGDDLYCTNKEYLQKGINEGASTAILIKLNQIGSLTETLETIQLAQANNQAVIISHRSGETEDTTIADLAVATNAEFIKTGSFSRSERLAKYNRLLEIEMDFKK
ncbi:MAG: phosphopyruvate hydratase [Mycoplasma sp.]